MKIVVAGIGTEVGKTIVSAIFCQAFTLNYWKPLQSGSIEDNDAEKIRELVSQSIEIFPNSYCFKEPLSPDQAAKLEGLTIDPATIQIPESDNLLIEPAGGLMVPLTENGVLFSDLLKKWNLPVVLVSRFYLGSINHTLLSIEYLKYQNIQLAGVVFTGDINLESEKIIRLKAPTSNFQHIPWSEKISNEFIEAEASKLRNSTFKNLFA
ncbi:MAG: dethiobiotin synthase [Bacteroidota bacterium]